MNWGRTAMTGVLLLTLLWIFVVNVLASSPSWTHYIAAAVIAGVSVVLAELFI